jgi:tetratricopeptide (TPR) repeat protein
LHDGEFLCNYGRFCAGGSSCAKPHSNKIIILLADFDGPGAQKYFVNETIRNRLTQALSPYEDVMLVPLQRSIKGADGKSIALAEGQDRGAAIVIWGEYSVTSQAVLLSVHFEVLNPVDYYPELGEEVQGVTRLHSRTSLESAILQVELSQELAYLTLFTIGVARTALGDSQGAIDNFTEALVQITEEVPALNKAIVHSFRGYAYSNLFDYDHAIHDYDLAVALNPDDPQRYIERGTAYKKRFEYRGGYPEDAKHAEADFSKAIELYSLQISLDPKNTTAYMDRAYVYYEAGEYGQAIADLERALVLEPTSFRALVNRGLAYSALEQYSDAVDSYVQAVNVTDQNASAYYNLGVVYLELEDYEQALNAFSHVIKMRPDERSGIAQLRFCKLSGISHFRQRQRQRQRIPVRERTNGLRQRR